MILRVRIDAASDPSRSRAGDWRRMTNFQRAMYRWSTLHPYHAVVVVELEGRLAIERLQQSVGDVLEELGMAGVEVDERERRYRYVEATVRADVEQAVLEDSTLAAAERRIARELNEPMARVGGFPLRVRGWEDGQGTTIAFSFDHWIGDGHALSCLVDRMVRRYLGTASPPSQPNRVASRSIGTAQDWVRPKRLAKLAWESVKVLTKLRSCYSPSAGDRMNLAAAVRVPPLPEDMLAKLRGCGRAQGATINDVLVAAVAEAVDGVTDRRRFERRRRNLAIAVVTSYRPSANEAQGTAGLYLGYFHAFLRGPSPGDFEEVVRSVKKQTSRIKRDRTDLRCELELGYSQWLWPRLSRADRLRQVLNNNPVAAGLSNLRPPEECFTDHVGRIRRFYFAVSPGVTTPLVLHTTTVGERMSATISWRASAYREEEVERVIERLRSRMEGL